VMFKAQGSRHYVIEDRARIVLTKEVVFYEVAWDLQVRCSVYCKNEMPLCSSVID
jgi:hypothetical protein